MTDYRVLIIDDDPAVVRMLEWAIEEHSLATVVGTATDGPSGERAALELRPDIILLDLLMPGQDGLETIQHLQDRGFEGTFVMISQVTAKEMVVSAYHLGVEYFIHKPLYLPEILAVLRRVTDGLQLRRALHTIQASLAPLAGLAQRPGQAAESAAPGSDLPRPERLRRVARAILADLGILGEGGASDLAAIPGLPIFAALLTERYELNQIYTALADWYTAQGTVDKAPNPRAIEQRIRRAAAAALTNMAALGLEDYADHRFEQMAAHFFDFNEVRTEMLRLRTGKGPSGRVNLKKFIDAFIHEVEARET